MWTRLLSVVLLLSLFSSSLYAQQPWSPSSSAERIIDLTMQLDENLEQQRLLIESLQTSNNEQQNLINRQLDSLKKSEESLKKQIALCKNLENLIEDQAIYQRKLERKLTFWRITSGALAVSLATGLILWGVTK